MTKFNFLEKVVLVGVAIVCYPVTIVWASVCYTKDYFEEVIRYVNGKEETKSIFIEIDEVRGHE